MLDQSKPIILYSDTSDFQAPEGQCDCACVSTVPVTKNHVPVNSNNAYKLSESFQTIAINNECVAALTETRGPFVLNNAALRLTKFFQQPNRLLDRPKDWDASWGKVFIQDTLNTLIDLGILTSDTSALQNHLEESQTTLSAWLHITDRCNLRCAYCYLPHKLKDMSLDTGKDSIDATIRSALKYGYKQVKFKYAGGEPLIKFNTIKILHQYALNQAKENGLDLDGVVLSNGTMLTKDIVSELKSLKLRLMVSLDGMGESNDKQRFYANGHGTFEDAVSGIQNAKELGILPDISVTVTGHNADGLAALVEWLLDQELTFGLNFYRENDFSKSLNELRLEEHSIIEGMLAAFAVIEKQLPDHSLLAALIDRANLAIPHLRTCGVGHSYLVFDYHGRVSKCQMHMNTIIADASMKDPLGLIRADQIGIQNISVEEKLECQVCEWKYWCAGGCPLTTFRATGRYDVKSPNCNIYKALYPEAVRLEGLRLLKLFDVVLSY